MLNELGRDWKYHFLRNNYIYNFAFFALIVSVGSAASVLYSCIAIWAIISIGLYRYELVADRRAVLFALLLCAYYASGVLNAVVHWGDQKSLFLLFERLPFLGFLPVFSRMVLSRPASVLQGVEVGALAGVIGGALISGFQYFSGEPRPEAFSGNSNVFAIGAGFAFVICLVAAWRRDGRSQHYFWAGLFCALLCMLFAGSRSVLFASAISTVVILLYFARTSSNKRSGLTIVTSLMAIALALGALLDLPGVTRFSLFQHLTTTTTPFSEDEFFGVRLEVWSCGYQIARDNVLLGAGWSSAIEQSLACLNAGFGTALGFSHFHNFIIASLAKGGLPEMIVTTLMLLVPLMGLRKDRRDIASGADLTTPRLAAKAIIAGAMIMFGVNGLFNVFLGHDVLDAAYLNLLICMMAVLYRTDPSRSGES